MAVAAPVCGTCKVWSDLDPTTFSLWNNQSGRNRDPRFSVARDAQAVITTNVDWVETPKEHIFKIDLPGVTRAEVQVEIEPPRTLKISGERVKEEVQPGDTWHRVERVRGRFLRRIRLPEDANLNAIKAETGVLKIVVPKVEEQKQETRRIDVGAGGGGQDAAQKGTSAAGSAGEAPKQPGA